jgi:hypothetical protein
MQVGISAAIRVRFHLPDRPFRPATIVLLHRP